MAIGDGADATALQQARRLVEKAKGLLMNQRKIDEDQAFRLLRSASMHAKMRIGQLSQQVIESALYAEGINRAGRLRMLSQRLVKLAAQRLAGVDPRRARALQEQAAERVQANLDHLAGWLSADASPAALVEALSATMAAWATLQHALAQRTTPEALAACDRHAAALLDCAEALTEALEQRSGRRSLRLVNLLRQVP